MSEGGFNLRKWHTNSRELRERIMQAENVHQQAQIVSVMGVNPGGNGGTRPPSFWSEGGRISNYPPPPTF
jgi:hypothetical protein